MRVTNLDMDALRSFVTGLDAGSFSRAADRLGRSTSAVSAQLKKLEEQVGVPLLRKSGRGLALTDGGEALLSYARRLIDLNDEAVSALRGVELEGWIRLGLQEDFGEAVLPQVLGRFARAHPKVRIEGRIARNVELLDKLAAGQLDLALAWDDGRQDPMAERIAELPLCWIGAASGRAERSSGELPGGWTAASGDPLPLAVLEAPCLLRGIATRELDRQNLSWRLAFISPSLGGLWAAAAAGLGVALRTPVGRPASVRMLEPSEFGLPSLPSLGLRLYRAEHIGATGEHLAAIIGRALRETLPQEWLLG